MLEVWCVSQIPWALLECKHYNNITLTSCFPYTDTIAFRLHYLAHMCCNFNVFYYFWKSYKVVSGLCQRVFGFFRLLTGNKSL